MSNAKRMFTTLYTNLVSSIRTYGTRENVSIFVDTFNGTLESATTIETQINGHSIQTLLHSLRYTLQTVADDESVTEKLRLELWNPIVAAFFSCIEVTAKEETTGIVKDSSQVKQLTKLTKALAVQAIPKPSQKARKNTVDPKDLSKCPTDVEARVRADFGKRKESSFFNQTHVKCRDVRCNFCVKLWHALPLSQCKDIKAHKRGTSCHKSGWYAHIFPPMWLAARKDHGIRDFQSLEPYSKRSIEPESQENESSMSVEHTNTRSPIKRKNSDSSENSMVITKRTSNFDWNEDSQEGVDSSIDEASLRALLDQE